MVRSAHPTGLESSRDLLNKKDWIMHTFTTVVERCPDTGLYVGYIPGVTGAHSQAESLDELQNNLREVMELLLEGGEPVLEAEFIGTRLIKVA